jgi:xanthosine utilization system XapX-like protein
MDTGTVERVIRVKRSAVLLQLLMLAAALGVVYLLPVRRPSHPGILSGLLGVFALYLIWPMVRACATGVAIEITSLGLVNHTGGVTFVGWHEIESARIGSPWGRKVVELDLHNPDVVLQRIGSLRGWSIRSYVKKYGGKPSINAYAAEGGAEAVLAEIRNRLGGMQITGLPRS